MIEWRFWSKISMDSTRGNDWDDWYMETVTGINLNERGGCNARIVVIDDEYRRCQ